MPLSGAKVALFVVNEKVLYPHMSYPSPFAMLTLSFGELPNDCAVTLAGAKTVVSMSEG